MRWKLFVNSFRRQGRDFEVIVQLVGLVALGAFVLGTSAGFYFGAVAAIIDPQRNICGLWEQKKAVATANELTKTGAGDPCGMHGRPPCRQRIRR